MGARPPAHGMRTFFIVWIGQLASTLGSNLAGFALGVWIYETTGSETLFAFSMLAWVLPNILLAPLAGVIADRWDRRLVMILSDSLAASGTLMVSVLLFSGHLAVWHVYIASFLDSTASTLQWPAHSAATSLMVPKEHLGRAGGLTQIGQAISQLVAPAAAGALYVTLGPLVILLVDLAAYALAMGTLLIVRFPQPEVTAEGQAGRGSFWKEALFGWGYIRARTGLFGLLIIFAVGNFLFSLTNPLMMPLLLDISSPDVVGYVSSIFGLGMLIGTLVMSIWGGPRRRIYGIVLFDSLTGLFGMLYGLRPSVPLIAAAAFGIAFNMPIVNGCSQAIWQSKVAQDVQGRVFAARRMIAFSIMPLAYLIAGPLAEHVFEPLLVEGGPLASSVGRVIGVGAGRGTGLLFMLVGVLYTLTTLIILIHPRIRRVELELPDAIPDSEEVGEAAPIPEGEATPSPAK